MAKKIITFQIDEELLSRLELVAEEECRSLSALLRFLVISYLKNKES
ncbi:MAG: hypothetical protein J6R47_05120 [Acholeplasmatales bacterium]|nr:hypothetical protein [Acholeplasmatales bacterium]